MGLKRLESAADAIIVEIRELRQQIEQLQADNAALCAALEVAESRGPDLFLDAQDYARRKQQEATIKMGNIILRALGLKYGLSESAIDRIVRMNAIRCWRATPPTAGGKRRWE